MSQLFLSLVPPEILKLSLVLFLSFLIGLEREELKQGGRKTFGGVRTFPLIGLTAYALAFIAQGQVLPMILGFMVVGCFMFLSYWHKLRVSDEAGITTEMSGLIVYLAADLIYLGHLWIAVTIIVACLLLLELKEGLEGLGKSIAPEEAAAFTKFLLLTAVILPLVPNLEFGPFHLNPFKTWLVVLAVCGVSYGSYVLQRLAKGRSGIFLTGILGGIYSSTATTVALAKRAASGHSSHAYSGGILAASGMMYLRIVVLVWIFNRPLAVALSPWFIALAVLAMGVGWVWSEVPSREGDDPAPAPGSQNPLELSAAFFFAFIFVLMVIATHLAVAHLGRGGVISLAGLMGVTDVDPFIMGLTTAAGRDTTIHLASLSIVVATASNNLAKAGYGCFFARKTLATGRWIFLLLAGLALLGLLPLFWL